MNQSALKAIREEVELANQRLAATVRMASGKHWRLAVELTGDEQEPRVVGVEDSSGVMVMGDCMSDVNNEVTVGDARFVAMMDASMVDGFRMLMNFSASLEVDSPLISMAYSVAVMINKKWDEAERDLGRKGKA
jgi:hypothetical protein